MNWNDYEAIWKRQALPAGAAADVTELRHSFETKRRKLAATLLVRDWVEASAGLLGAIAFAFIWWLQGKSGWPIAGAILLILGVTAVFIRERIRAHRLRLGADAPLLAKLDADLAELHHQRRLLLSVWKWYLAPCGAAIVIVSLTISLHRPAWDLARDGRFLGVYFACTAGMRWVVWLLNRQAVRKQLDPRVEELEKLRRDLLSTS